MNRPEITLSQGVMHVIHLTPRQKEQLLGIMLSILASLLFAVADNIMSEDEEVLL